MNAPVDQIAAAAQEARQICAAIALLPPRQRAAIYLREVRGLSYEEIGAESRDHAEGCDHGARARARQGQTATRQHLPGAVCPFAFTTGVAAPWRGLGPPPQHLVGRRGCQGRGACPGGRECRWRRVCRDPTSPAPRKLGHRGAARHRANPHAAAASANGRPPLPEQSVPPPPRVRPRVDFDNRGDALLTTAAPAPAATVSTSSTTSEVATPPTERTPMSQRIAAIRTPRRRDEPTPAPSRHATQASRAVRENARAASHSDHASQRQRRLRSARQSAKPSMAPPGRSAGARHPPPTRPPRIARPLRLCSTENYGVRRTPVATRRVPHRPQQANPRIQSSPRKVESAPPDSSGNALQMPKGAPKSDPSPPRRSAQLSRSESRAWARSPTEPRVKRNPPTDVIGDVYGGGPCPQTNATKNGCPPVKTKLRLPHGALTLPDLV